MHESVESVYAPKNNAFAGFKVNQGCHYRCPSYDMVALLLWRLSWLTEK